MQHLITACQASITRMLAQCDAATPTPWYQEEVADGDEDGIYAQGRLTSILFYVENEETYDVLDAGTPEDAAKVRAAVNMHRAALELLQYELSWCHRGMGLADPLLRIARVLATADPAVADALRMYEGENHG